MMPFDRLKIEVAAQDSDLKALYELRMCGFTSAVSGQRAALIEDMDSEDEKQLVCEVARDYCLSPAETRQVIGHCIADIAGLQVGLDLFEEGSLQ
jgi:hypothetical protein